MRPSPLRLLLALPAILPLLGAARPARELTFQQRVDAQRAIERVLYAHQIGATRPFDEAVPREVLERMVRNTLRESAALERIWKRPVTALMLDREASRIAAGTRMPDRLRELHRALGDDPVLIEETLVRAVLVDRLARHFFGNDPSRHAVERARAEILRADLVRGAIDPRAPAPGRSEVTLAGDERPAWLAGARGGADVGPVQETAAAYVVDARLEDADGAVRLARYGVPKRGWDDWWARTGPTLDAVPVPAVSNGAMPLLSGPCVADDTWDNGTLDDVPSLRSSFASVWTGSVMIIWGGDFAGGSLKLDSGSRYDPVTDSWSSTTAAGAPSARSHHTAVWTGTRMVVWGGTSDTTGGQYDPVADSWTATSTVGAPSPRADHTAVWTGARMVVWGGASDTTGAQYDPSTDTWTPTSTANAPAARSLHTAVWTGSRMIVWGGLSGTTALDTGASYDPAADTWTPLTASAPPSGRYYHSAIWTGAEMIVWGGDAGFAAATQTGGRLDPAANTWTPTSTTNAPDIRARHSAIWTGSRMIIWGGVDNTCCDQSDPKDTGGIYDPSADSWIATSTTGAPDARDSHTAFWIGGRMLIWGGQQTLISIFGTQTLPRSTGGQYDLASDSWTPTSVGDGPGTGAGVWTGSEMIVWGDTGGTGSRYDPALDAWTPMATANAPDARSSFSLTWAGSRAIVWGGSSGVSRVNTGARYDPVTDTWAPTTTADAPAARTRHTAVWTGTRLIVWGGQIASNTRTSTGGIYDPVADAWTATSTSGAPAARDLHAAVWSGGRMIVWGGNNGSAQLSTGGQYDPAADVWTATSTTGAPVPRDTFTAVWTGSRMIVWGGVISAAHALTSSGGIYDPSGDTWLPTTLTGAPSARSGQSALWTGKVMLIWAGEITNTGGRYDPAVDAWQPTSLIGVPAPRSGQAAVWTGVMMIVWGGSHPHNGGRYGLDQSADADGDGRTICSGDCDDSQAAAWSTPGEVPSLDLAPGAAPAVTLSWSAPSDAGGTSLAYDALRTTDAGDYTSVALCLVTDDPALVADDSESPPPGAVFFYLVRARNLCPGAAGVGSLGSDSSGAPRAGRSCP